MAYKVFGIEEALSADINSYLMSQMDVICTSSTRPSPVDGMRIWQTDTKTGLVYVQSMSKWCVLTNTIKYVKKTADESLASSTTLQDDDHLFIAVEPNTTYRFYALLGIAGIQANDFRMSWTGPAGATFVWSTQSPHLGMTNTTITTISVNYFSAFTDVADIGTDTSQQGTHIYALLKTAGTGGTVRLQWAQSTSSATIVKVFSGSFMYLMPVE